MSFCVGFFFFINCVGVLGLHDSDGGDECGWGEIMLSFGGPRHLSIIPLKDSHLFKIAELVISFYFNFFNSVILNRCKSFSRMMDYVTYPPWEPYNLS